MREKFRVLAFSASLASLASSASSEELRGTARLLSTTLKPHFILRGVLLAAGGIALPLLVIGAGTSPGPHDAVLLAAAWALAAAGEILERYLFFVSTVPTHLAAPYLSLNAEAA